MVNSIDTVNAVHLLSELLDELGSVVRNNILLLKLHDCIAVALNPFSNNSQSLRVDNLGEYRLDSPNLIVRFAIEKLYD